MPPPGPPGLHDLAIADVLDHDSGISDIPAAFQKSPKQPGPLDHIPVCEFNLGETDPTKIVDDDNRRISAGIEPGDLHLPDINRHKRKSVRSSKHNLFMDLALRIVDSDRAPLRAPFLVRGSAIIPLPFPSLGFAPRSIAALDYVQ